MKTIIIRIILIILLIINCATIFKFSSEVADDSNNRSGRVVSFIVDTLPGLKEKNEQEKEYIKGEILTQIVRKTAHFSIYASMGMITVCFALTYKGTYYQKSLCSILFCICYSISDEIHQLFVQGRSCEFRDICIDTLGVIVGILIIYAVYKIYRIKKEKKQKEQKQITKDTKILFISSTGGHFSELMQLKPIMDKCNYHIVTEKKKQNIKLKDNFGKKIDFLVYETKKKPLKYIFVLLINSIISFCIYLKFRPQVVITTGTHTAGPMCCIARLLGSKVIYIETYANRMSKTSAGKLLYYVANEFIVQWEEMKKLYPKARYFGGIY